ncbi:MAG: PaREP1 family protein [Dehalococcoidia bacterium]
MAQERYTALNGKYLEDAEALLAQGDYPQASEKLWGAVATAIKTVAAARRWRHHSHNQLRAVIKGLHQETGDREFSDLFATAEALHANFYENFAAPDEVRQHSQSARLLIDQVLAQLR